MFYQLSKFNCVKNKQDKQVSWHPFLEKGTKKTYCYSSNVDRVLPLKSDQKWTYLVNLSALGNRALYLEIFYFLILTTIPL